MQIPGPNDLITMDLRVKFYVSYKFLGLGKKNDAKLVKCDKKNLVLVKVKSHRKKKILSMATIFWKMKKNRRKLTIILGNE